MELKTLSSIHYSSEATGRNSENSSYFKVQLLSLREASTEHGNTLKKKKITAKALHESEGLL